MNDDSLLVLRFRDIELPSGETIVRHRRTIAEQGYCWWGWLFRDYERNPHADLRRYGEGVTDRASATIALFDTGRGGVYRATCQEIRATPSPQRSPQPLATPGYYNDRRAPAWFKLSEIEEADASLLVGRVCVAMPSASEECFVDLLDRTVEHIKDLRRQEVTLWVLA